MQNRLNALRAALTGAACDSFVSFSPPANEYISGFRGSTSAIVISRERAILLCDFRYTEQAQNQVANLEVLEVTGSLEQRAGETLAELGCVQTAFDPGALSVAQFDVLKSAFTGVLAPHPALLARLRMVKSTLEIEKLRAASQLAEAVLLNVLGELRTGLTEREFAARIEYEFKVAGAEKSSFSPIVLFGARSSLPHGVPGPRALEHGDIILLDFGCVLDGYCSDCTRTYVFGTIPGVWFEDIYTVTLRAQLAALAAVRPGVACRDVDAAARDIIREAGYGPQFGHGTGHGVGLEIHEAPRLNLQSEAVLEPGMVVTVEPGIYLPARGGVRIEDLVVVTEDGCEVLTTTSKELKVLNA